MYVPFGRINCKIQSFVNNQFRIFWPKLDNSLHLASNIQDFTYFKRILA